MLEPIITVVGSCNTDLVVRVPHLPLPGETLLGSDVQRVAGGKGANQAIAARRIGATVHFITCLGDDDFGKVAAIGLAKEGLRLDHLVHMPNIPSGVALIAVAGNGENSIIVAPGANARLSPADVGRAVIAIQASQMVVAQLEVPLNTVQQAFALARQHGVRTLLNPAPAQPLPANLLTLVDVLVCNETEAETLTGQAVHTNDDARQAAAQLRERGPQIVIVTLGGDGCLVLSDALTEHIAAFPVQVVDTTAAGDAFIGALATQMATGGGLSLALRYATAAAALSVGVLGAQPSLPASDHVVAFLRNIPKTS